MFHRTLIALLAALVFLQACGSSSGSDDADADATDVVDERGARPVDVGREDTAPPPPDAVEDTTATPDVVVDVPPPPRFSSLRVEPPAVEIVTTLGVPNISRVAVIGTSPEGLESDVTSEARWYSESMAHAQVARDGTVTAGGYASGDTRIMASVDDANASATVTVRVSELVIAEDVSPDEVVVFTTGPPAPEPVPPTWLYPENETVYPAGLQAPLLQWRHDSDSLFHLVVAVGDHARIDVYTRARSFALDDAQWSLIGEHFGEPVTMTLQSTTGIGGAVQTAAPHTLVTADASLEGSVYYWQIATGDIMEIPYDDPIARPLFPDNANTGNCRGCHAITRDGGRIGFMYNGGDNPRAGLAWVDAPDPPIIANGTDLRWDFLSFEPAGLRAAAVFLGDMWLADTTPDAAVTNLGPVPGVNDEGRRVTTPARSPDGTLLAFVARDPGGVDWSFTWGDLWVTPWDAATEGFGAPRMLVPRGDGDQDTISYPTWSPDGRWLAYSRGPDNRGEPPANLFIADPLTGDSTQLLRGAPAGQDVLPAFSPFREGGYYWLLFYSRRPYGDVTTNKQLWVMAIDERHVTGLDPSYPAFWLPGQDPAEVNITAYWAPEGCARESGECKTDDDCCVGLQCIDEEGLGTGTCQRVDCVFPGRSCTEGDVCCPGYECASSLVGSTVCVEAFDR